jgi:hypothetical protein
MYQWGKFEAVSSANKDIDISAYLADLRVDAKLGPGNLFVEGLYMSGGDDPTGDKYEAPITLETTQSGPGGNSAYSRTNSVLLMSSPDTINVSQCLIGCSGGVSGSDPGNFGRGIWLVGAGYKMKLTERITGDVNVNYLSATKMLNTDPSNRDKDMGTEVNAQVTYNIMKGLDFSLVGAYAWLGDFYKTASGNTPDDIYTGYAKINYAY